MDGSCLKYMICLSVATSAAIFKQRASMQHVTAPCSQHMLHRVSDAGVPSCKIFVW